MKQLPEQSFVDQIELLEQSRDVLEEFAVDESGLSTRPALGSFAVMFRVLKDVDSSVFSGDFLNLINIYLIFSLGEI